MRVRLLPATLVAALVGACLVASPAQADATFSVSGHVTTGSSDAVVQVSLIDGDGTDVADTGDGDVSDSGDYTITDVPPGTYTVEFTDIRADSDSAYLSRFYGDIVTEDSTTDGVKYFTVSTANVTGIDGILDLVPFAEKAKPTISGSPRFGKTLSVDAGDWAEDPDFEYQWYRGNTAIPDATDDTYEITASDLGQSLYVDVTATEQGYIGWESSSAAIAIPRGTKFTSVKPRIIGTPTVGKTVKVVTGAWSPSGVKFRYLWTLNGKPIPKATKAKLKLKPAYAGKKLRVVVTGGKIGVGATVAVSKAVKVKR